MHAQLEKLRTQSRAQQVETRNKLDVLKDEIQQLRSNTEALERQSSAKLDSLVCLAEEYICMTHTQLMQLVACVADDNGVVNAKSASVISNDLYQNNDVQHSIRRSFGNITEVDFMKACRSSILDYSSCKDVNCDVFSDAVVCKRLYDQINHAQKLFKQWPELAAKLKYEHWSVHNADVIIAAAERLTGKQLACNIAK
jgi:hypothetical protein